MYLNHFKMKTHPFTEPASMDMILQDQRISEALARLEYLATQGTIGLLTGPAGVYAIAGLDAGSYALTATAAGYAPSEAADVVLPPDAAGVDFGLGAPVIDLDPEALTVAVSAARAVEMLGMPEARYALAEATVYLATAPKSRSCADAIARASEDIGNGVAMEVPDHLRDASYTGAGRLGHGEGYSMPTSEAEGRAQEYVPGRREYYRPGEGGYEREVRERVAEWDRAPKSVERDGDDDAGRGDGRTEDRN